MHRNDLDRVAGCQLRQNVDQQAQGRGGKFDAMSFVPLVENLDVLSLEMGREVSSQSALPFNGGFYFAFYREADRGDMASPALGMRNAGTLFEISENRNKRNECWFYDISANTPCTYSTNARAFALAIRPVGNTAHNSCFGNTQSLMTAFTAPLASSGANIHSEPSPRP